VQVNLSSASSASGGHASVPTTLVAPVPTSVLIAMVADAVAAPRSPRLAVDLAHAAAALDVSKKFFDEHIRHELRVVRRGRKVLVPVRELERWLDENAALTLSEERWR
jgi:hypothetical protein